MQLIHNNNNVFIYFDNNIKLLILRKEKGWRRKEEAEDEVEKEKKEEKERILKIRQSAGKVGDKKRQAWALNARMLRYKHTNLGNPSITQFLRDMTTCFSNKLQPHISLPYQSTVYTFTKKQQHQISKYYSFILFASPAIVQSFGVTYLPKKSFFLCGENTKKSFGVACNAILM